MSPVRILINLLGLLSTTLILSSLAVIFLYFKGKQENEFYNKLIIQIESTNNTSKEITENIPPIPAEINQLFLLLNMCKSKSLQEIILYLRNNNSLIKEHDLKEFQEKLHQLSIKELKINSENESRKRYLNRLLEKYKLFAYNITSQTDNDNLIDPNKFYKHGIMKDLPKISGYLEDDFSTIQINEIEKLKSEFNSLKELNSISVAEKLSFTKSHENLFAEMTEELKKKIIDKLEPKNNIYLNIYNFINTHLQYNE